MKTKITLLCLLIAMSFSSKAQTYVTIPDSVFVWVLQGNYPTCMVGNQMDTACTGIMNETGMFISYLGISDLTGLQYFDSLQYLDCSQNLLITLPPLPNSIWHLECNDNQLTSLPNIPTSLIEFNCFNNQITNLPPLSNSLQTLFAFNNQLTSLPTLPNSLQNIAVENNFITSLPVLPNSLGNLRVSNNLLTSLPALPNSLGGGLWVDNNQLTSLPTLPMISGLYCDNNNISCFPQFPASLWDTNQFSLAGNPSNCLPNYVPGMNAATLAFPLCIDGDLVNNPNGCLGSKGIVGTIYKDNTSNCIMNPADQGTTNVHLKLYDNSNNLLAQMYSFSNGVYDFPDPAGTYTVTLDILGMPYTVQCVYPGIDSTVSLTVTNPLVTDVNFNIICKPGFDVAIQSVLPQGWIFPGIQHQLSVAAGDMSNWYDLHCASGISGQVQITITGPVTYSGIASGALIPSVAINVFTYTIADFANVNMQHDFGLLFTTDTSAQAGDQVCVNVVITPTAGDNNTSNNNFQFCYNVLNSYDPNMKEVYPVDVAPNFQDYFTYTIHFQNTGTAPAMNIRLTDTLDGNLDLETFQVLNYSHYNTVSVKNEALTLHFPNIQLPDSTSNLEGSQGFVQYRIKPKANLPLGTQIKNTANIYFDYNAAVVTNTTTNEYVQIASISENKIKASLNVYPNPGNGKYFVKLSEGINVSELNMEVYNLMGELVLNSKMKNNVTQLDLSDQPNGIYIVRVLGGKQSLNQHVVKQ